jgi:hypothetical protein
MSKLNAREATRAPKTIDICMVSPPLTKTVPTPTKTRKKEPISSPKKEDNKSDRKHFFASCW